MIRLRNNLGGVESRYSLVPSSQIDDDWVGIQFRKGRLVVALPIMTCVTYYSISQVSIGIVVHWFGMTIFHASFWALILAALILFVILFLRLRHLWNKYNNPISFSKLPFVLVFALGALVAAVILNR